MKENASEWEMIYSPEACETFNKIMSEFSSEIPKMMDFIFSF